MANEDSFPLNSLGDFCRKKAMYKIYRPKLDLEIVKNVLFCLQNTQSTRKNCFWVLHVLVDHVSCTLMLLCNSDMLELVTTYRLSINHLTVRARNILYSDFIEPGGFSLYERWNSSCGMLAVGYEKITPCGVLEFDEKFIDIETFRAKILCNLEPKSA